MSLTIRIYNALKQIAEKEGLCIYGTLELREIDDIRQAFQLGSHMAFAECARIAREALGKEGREGVA